MSDKEYTIADMINAAKGESPSEFNAAFTDVLLDKVNAAIDAKKIEVAQNYFNNEEEESEPTAEDEETSNEDDSQQEEPSNEDPEAAAGKED